MTRRRTLLLALALLALAVVLLILLTVGLAVRSMQQGISEVHAAEASLTIPRVERDPRGALVAARRHLVAAHGDFRGASQDLARVTPVLHALGWVPRVGPLAASLPSAAALGNNAAAGALHLVLGLESAASVLHNRHGDARSRAGELVTRLAAARPEFTQACANLDRARSEARSIDASAAPALQGPLRTFNRETPRLLTACHMLAVLPTLLGSQAPRTYLVAYQDPSELRATGGFLGSIGVLTVRDGRVTQQFHGTGLNRNWAPGTLVPSPEPIDVYNNEPYWLLLDSNWSPDFPTSAQLERFFVKLTLHRSVSGVIDVTPQATADVLKAIGPIYSPEYHRWITAGNVDRLADYYSHWSAYYGPSKSGNSDTQRKQFIGIISNRILKRIQSLSPSGMLSLGRAIATAALQRDLQVWVDTRRAERSILSAGAGGEINPTRSDYLYVVDTNISYTKNNGFVHTSVAYRARIRRNRWTDARLDIRFTNLPAPESYRRLGWLGPGGGTLGGWDDYASFVRIFVPLGARLVDQSGWFQPWSPGVAYGKTMLSGYLLVPRGETRTIHLHYVIPPNIFTWSGGSRYRLVVQRQPGKILDGFAVSVVHDGHTWSRRVEHPLTDWSHTIPIESRPIYPIPLPAQPPTVVAPNHQIEPFAYLGTPH